VQTAGRFITLEGPEGAGKTLQAERLADALRARGSTVLLTREPGGTRLGDELRTVVLARDGGVIEPRTDALLFNAARAQLVGEVINPALVSGVTVVCARFADSTLAYQGYGAGLPRDELRTLEEFLRAHGSVNGVARALFLHRNTVRQRLKRIGELTGADLEDADQRVQLYLAVLSHNALRELAS